MQVVSYFSALYKICYDFSKWKVVQPPACSLDSSYTKHGNPHFSIQNITWIGYLVSAFNTWLPLATLSVHALKSLPSHDRFEKWHFVVMTAVECTATGWLTGYGSCALHCLSQLVCATYLGPLHTRAKSRDHEIVRSQKRRVQRPSQHTSKLM